MEIKKIKESTLKNQPTFINDRRCGNTTRLIDHAIQIIFSGKCLIVEDSYQKGKHKEANSDLYKRILNRLSYEHNLTREDVLADNKELTIELIK